MSISRRLPALPMLISPFSFPRKIKGATYSRKDKEHFNVVAGPPSTFLECLLYRQQNRDGPFVEVITMQGG